MASLDKMSIRGIRSFSPNHEEVIKFFHPLTVIVGQNGCGKTTVIESLKYITTGTVPPDSHSGQSFIHDPRMSGTTEVKAQLKLRFVDTTGGHVLCNRQFSLTKKPKSMQFKALEAVLVRTDARTGRKKSISKRCTDMDTMLPGFLGVSRAVLQNVVFCHQEESAWPVQEGAPLKKKLDEIFESTRYSKALTELQEQKKKYKAQLKELEVSVKWCSEIASSHQTLQDRLADLESSSLSLAEERAAAEELRDQAQAEVNRLNALADEHRQLIENKRVDELSLQMKNQEFEDIFASVGERLDATPEQLDETLTKFESVVQTWEKKKTQAERQVEELNRQVEVARNKQSVVLQRQGKLESVEEEQQRSLKEFNAKADEIALKHAVRGWQTLAEWDTEQVSQLEQALDAMVSTRTGELKAVLDKNRRKLAALDEAVQKATVEATNAEMEVKSVRAEMLAVDQEIATTSQRLRALPSTREARAQLKELEVRKREKEGELSTLQSSGKREQLQEQVRAVDGQIRDTRAEQSKLREMTALLRRQDDKRVRLAEREELLGQKEASLQDEVNRLRGRFSAVIGQDVNPATVVTDLEGVRQRRNAGFAEAERKFRKASAALNTVRGQREATTRQLAEVRRRVQATKADKRYTLLQSHADRLGCALSEVGDTVEAEFAQLTKQYEAERYIVKTLTLLQEEVQDLVEQGGKAPCPLCGTDIKEEGECGSLERMVQLVKDRKAHIKSVQSQRFGGGAEKPKAVQARAKRQCAEVKAATRVLLELESHEADEQRCINSDKKLGAQLEVAAAKVEEARGDMEAAQRSKQQAEDLVPSAHALRSLNQEVANTRRDVEDLRASLAASTRVGVPAGMTMDKATSQAEQLEIEFDHLSRKAKSLQEAVTEESRKEDRCQRELTDLQQEALAIQQKLSQHRELEGVAKRAQAKRKKLAATETELQRKLPPLQRAVTAATDARRAASEHLQGREDAARERARVIDADAAEIRGSIHRLRRVMRRNVRAELATLKNDSVAASNEVEAASRAIAEHTAVINKARERVSSADKQLRRLQDEKRLRMLSSDIDALEAKVGEAAKTLKASAGSNLTKQIKKATKELAKASHEVSLLEGRSVELQAGVNEVTHQLRDTKFTDIDDRVREEIIRFETTKLAVEDLEKYHLTLDKALMRYHNLKINEINKNIRDLWVTTYRGGDIDTIEIKSDLDAGRTKRGRTYNYRVVMRKGTAELDMKGRCSAGQKVLASLIIRMALAETFCVNCGILALDEPTTNLDEDNKKALARSLANLVADRAEQRNFQLIVITHDSDWATQLSLQIKALQSGASAPWYYRLSREDTGHGVYRSVIEQQDFE